MRKRNFNILLILFVVILLFGLGYAYLTTTLSINGTTDVDANNWNVYWDNVQVFEGSVTASAPVIDTSKTTVSFSVHLSKPGDYYAFTVDAKNDGSIDAMIETINKTINNSTTVPSYLNYNVTYYDDNEIENNQPLKANTKETYKVKIEYRTDLNPNDLPSTAQSLTLSFGITYVQADNNVSNIRNYIYSSRQASSYSWTIGDPIPQSFVYFDTYQQAMNYWNNDIFLRSNIKDDRVFSSDIGFIIDGNLYYLLGSNLSHTKAEITEKYLKNKATMIQAFGIDNCTTWNYGTECYYNSMSASVYNDNGTIKVKNDTNNLSCNVINSLINNAEAYTYYCGIDNTL